MSHETILVVDDEPAIVQVIRERLMREGFQVRAADTGQAALDAVGEALPDLLILDLMLPDMDGFEVLRRLCQSDGVAARHPHEYSGEGMAPTAQSLPVIVLTARDDDVDVVVGLELGADDYVVKPFNPRELVARVRAVLRRRAEALAWAARAIHLEAQLPSPSSARAPDQDVLPPGIHFEPLARRAWFAGQLLDLRPREYDLLFFLAQHQGQVLSRTMLLDHVWGTADFIDDRTVDVHVHRLRQKLAEIDPSADPIQTERGIGYRLEL